MSAILTRNFHSGLKSTKAGERKIYILEKWTSPVHLIGVQFGLLCYPTGGTILKEIDGIEIYICVSRNPDIDDTDNFLILKQDYLFYAQRDAYGKCIGIKDLLDWQMLPSGKWFEVSEADPIYIKFAVSNISKEPAQYDAWANMYYE